MYSECIVYFFSAGRTNASFKGKEEEEEEEEEAGCSITSTCSLRHATRPFESKRPERSAPAIAQNRQ